MVNKYILDELMKISSDNSTNIFQALDILKGMKVELIVDEKTYDTVYQVKLEDILCSNLDNQTLLTLRNGGWHYSDDGEYLIKNMNEK